MKSKDIKQLLALALCGLLAQPIGAQQTYSLDSCRALALRNNVRIHNAANEVEAAKEGSKEANTLHFPKVSASAMAYNADKGLMEMDLGPGMNLSLLRNGIMGGVTVTQPIYTGGQITNANLLAELGVEVSKIKQKQSQDEVCHTVEQYFWQVAVLQEKLHTLHSVETQLESIQKDVEMAVNAGIKTRNDLLQVQLHHNDIQSSRMNLANDLHVCRMMLAQYVGVPSDTINIDCTIPLDTLPAFPLALQCDHAAALPHTVNYQLLESNVNVNLLQQKMLVSKNKPTVAVGLGCMYDNLMDKSHPFAIGFVSVSVPISDWWTSRHAQKKQELMTRNAENQLSDNSMLLVIAMQKAWNDVQNAYKQMGLAHEAITQSTENLRLNKDYYHVGTCTMSDLLNAQTLYQQSCDRYVEAYADFQIKVLEYIQATGR